jgi:hypothetical protein
LVVETGGLGPTTQFALLDARTLRVLQRFTLHGTFTYDALSPNARTLYLIQYVDWPNSTEYVVRAYDAGRHALRPGRIADRSQQSWEMEGTAVTRTASVSGRWVYTLYERPGGYPFIHALDTINGVAHCIGLPWSGDQTPLANVRLSLGGGGRTLEVHWKSGKPWLTVDTKSWRLTHVVPRGSFPWRWAVVGAAAAVLFLLLVLARRPRREPVPARAV